MVNFVNTFSCPPPIGKRAFPPFPRRPARANFTISRAAVNIAEARLLDILNFLNIVNFGGAAAAG